MMVSEVWLVRFSSSVCRCCKSALVTSGWYEIFAMGVSLMNLLSLYRLVSRIILPMCCPAIIYLGFRRCFRVSVCPKILGEWPTENLGPAEVVFVTMVFESIQHWNWNSKCYKGVLNHICLQKMLLNWWMGFHHHQVCKILFGCLFLWFLRKPPKEPLCCFFIIYFLNSCLYRFALNAF